MGRIDFRVIESKRKKNFLVMDPPKIQINFPHLETAHKVKAMS